MLHADQRVVAESGGIVLSTIGQARLRRDGLPHHAGTGSGLGSRASRLERSSDTIHLARKAVAPPPSKRSPSTSSPWRSFMPHDPLVVVCASECSALRLVAAAYTSIRCRRCGYTDPSNRESQALFRCRGCGWSEDADIHAAKNIRHLGTVGWVAPSQNALADGQAAAGRGGGTASGRLRPPWRRPAFEASTNGAHASSRAVWNPPAPAVGTSTSGG